MMHGGTGGYGFLWMVFLGIIIVVPFWKICVKAGYPGIISLLVLIPILNIALLYFLAFAPWPTGEKQGTE